MYKYTHKPGGGTGGRVICCWHLWEPWVKKEHTREKKKRRFKQTNTKRRAPTHKHSRIQRR